LDILSYAYMAQGLYVLPLPGPFLWR